MGIDGFGVLLKKQCPQVFRACSDAMLVDKRIAIDMHIIVYQMFHRNGGHAEAVKADVRRFGARLKSLRASPIFVFDGKTTGLKPRAHAMRSEATARSAKTLSRLKTENAALHDTLTRMCFSSAAAAATEDDDEPVDVDTLLQRKQKLDADIAKLGTRAIRPSFDLFRDIQGMLCDEFGPATVQHAADDGERRVAELCSRGDVDFAVSSDYDTLVFGSRNLIVNILSAEKMALLHLDDVITGLGFASLAQLRDFCILCGCDFCNKIPGLGPMTALRIIRTFGNIDDAMGPVLAAKVARHGIDFDYAFARSRFAANDTP